MMNRFAQYKAVRFILGGIAVCLLTIYGWFYSGEFKNNISKKLTNKMPTDSDDLCAPDKGTQETITKGQQENPNIKLFISCGGFLE